MLIDIVFVVLMLLAIIEGYRKGFIIAVFSFIAVIIGLAAAMKLSVVVSNWLKASTQISERWLPVLAFAIVMIAVVLLVRWCALLIEKSLQLVMLGMVNKIAGIILYAIVYTIFLSVVLFYASKMELIKPETISESRTYAMIEPWGPKVIDAIGVIIPFFKNMFIELEHFFDNLAGKATVH